MVSVVDGRPVAVGALPRSGVAVAQTRIDEHSGQPYEYVPIEMVLDVWTYEGQLVVRWNQVRTQVGYVLEDQRHVTVRYRWDGATFVPLGESGVEIVPPYVQPG